MTDLEIKAGFLALDPDHPFYRALLALLDNEVETETAGAIAPDLADGARHYNAGRLAQAKNIRMVVEGVMKDAIGEAQAELQRREQLAERKKAEETTDS